MSAGKPWLLKSINNHRGRETTLTYTPSTTFYLEARRAGTPWATRLPFPVQCLSGVESRDHITGWRFASTYSYHHGYFDGPEREFRGFGRVDTWDTESVSDYEGATNGDLAFFQPPVLTKTWFHTGAWKDAKSIDAAFAAEYWSGDGSAEWLSRNVLPSGLTPQERREAHRALKGQMLRSEVYALDGSADEGKPYTVSQTRVEVRQIQKALSEDTPGVYLVVPKESLSRHYERNVSDPRTTHSLTLEVDEFGTVLRSASVAYPRRDVSGRTSEQGALAIGVSEQTVIHDTTATTRLHLAVPDTATTWELTGYSPTSVHDGALLTPEGLNSDFEGATALSFEEEPSGTGFEKRLLSQSRVRYWNDTLSAALSQGQLGDRALVHQKYQLALTAGLIEDVFDLGAGSLVGSTELTEAGYLDLDSDGNA